MPKKQIQREVEVQQTARVQQLYGLFDVNPTNVSRLDWKVDLPVDDKEWSIGLIVGPSGSGKSTIATELFGDSLIEDYDWPHDKSIVDAFPKSMSIKDITGALSRVGFSSPPSWLRPYRCLSTGQKFRALVARALCEEDDMIVIDEFTSVVDRTIAKVGSAAIAKGIRRAKKQFIAVTCHYDVEEWLQPDWVYDLDSGFRWRSLRRRPEIDLVIEKAPLEAWSMFAPHHYLTHKISRSAKCYVAMWNGEPVAFTSAVSFPHPKSPGWTLHRTVTLPDFQGVGIGVAVTDAVASMYASLGKPVRRVTSNPALIRHCAKSRNWTMVRRPARIKASKTMKLEVGTSIDRITASFKWVGPITRINPRA